MFSTLETTWDRSARRGWTTLVSFIFQGLALSLLFAVPLFWIEGLPRLRFSEILPPPPGPASPEPQGQRPVHSSSNLRQGHVIDPESIPRSIAILNEAPVPEPPDLRDGVPGGTARPGGGVRNSILQSLNAVAPPPVIAHVVTHPIRLSHMAEGNLVYRVQPEYPEIARQARIQGPVQLRAIISKTGTIENLVVESGPPVLVRAALNAVGQWRYRPYLLNGEPVEVETEITVNFILGG
jgi:periplasmic protein TonB